MRVHLECVLSLRDSVLKCVSNDHKIEDIEAENVYIYII